MRSPSASSAELEDRGALDGQRSPQGRPSRSAETALLSAGDVAEMMGMTKDWVYAETRAGRIPHVQLGRYYRYRVESIEAWIQEIEDHPRRPRAGRLR